MIPAIFAMGNSFSKGLFNVSGSLSMWSDRSVFHYNQKVEGRKGLSDGQSDRFVYLYGMVDIFSRSKKDIANENGICYNGLREKIS